MSNTFIDANKKGHTYIDNTYMYDNRLTPTEKTLYSIIYSACYANKTECTPSQSTLSKALNRSVRTVQRCLNKLKELGYIATRRRGSISNVICVLAKKTKQVGERVANSIKKAVTGSKNQNKGNKKPSGWHLELERNYDFNKLEQALTGQINYPYEELLE